MKSLKYIISDIKSTSEIKGLMEVYEEIAAAKMQRIRKTVTASCDYFEGLAKLSEEVALDLDNAFEGKNKFAAVFLSANTGLYGDLIDKILVSFVDFVKENNLDAYIVGKLGATLIKSYAPEVKFSELNIDGDKEDIDEAELENTLQFLSGYSKIYIFHGRFESIARQDSLSSTISGPDIQKYGIDGKDEKEIAKKRLIHIYEPSVEEVGNKFAKEISLSIFDNSIKENQLAKYAARLMHLDFTIDNIDSRLGKLDNEKKRTRKKMEQKKQTERTARWQRV